MTSTEEFLAEWLLLWAWAGSWVLALYALYGLARLGFWAGRRYGWAWLLRLEARLGD